MFPQIEGIKVLKIGVDNDLIGFRSHSCLTNNNNKVGGYSKVQCADNYPNKYPHGFQWNVDKGVGFLRFQ